MPFQSVNHILCQLFPKIFVEFARYEELRDVAFVSEFAWEFPVKSLETHCEIGRRKMWIPRPHFIVRPKIRSAG